MIRKKYLLFLIIGVILFSNTNVLAVEDNDPNTLDIEKAAITAINNSQSVKDFDTEKINMDRKYNDSQNSTALTLSRGIPNTQAIILNPILAKNTLDQFLTQRDVNTKTVILDVYSKYVALLKANYAVNIQMELTDNLKKEEEEAKLQLNNGLISQSAERLAEINYLKADYQLSKFQRSIDSAYMTINLAIGQDMSKRYNTLIDYNIVAYKPSMTSQDYVKNALLKRGEIVNAQNALTAKKKVLEYTSFDSVSDYQFYSQKAQYDVDNSQNSLDKAKINIQLELENGYKTLTGYIKTAESQQANYDLAEANYEAAKIQFSNTMISLSQFEGFEVAKAQAQMNQKNAQLDAWLQGAKMNFASNIGPALN